MKKLKKLSDFSNCQINCNGISGGQNVGSSFSDREVTAHNQGGGGADETTAHWSECGSRISSCTTYWY